MKNQFLWGQSSNHQERSILIQERIKRLIESLDNLTSANFKSFLTEFLGFSMTEIYKVFIKTTLTRLQSDNEEFDLALWQSRLITFQKIFLPHHYLYNYEHQILSIKDDIPTIFKHNYLLNTFKIKLTQINQLIDKQLELIDNYINIFQVTLPQLKPLDLDVTLYLQPQLSQYFQIYLKNHKLITLDYLKCKQEIKEQLFDLRIPKKFNAYLELKRRLDLLYNDIISNLYKLYGVSFSEQEVPEINLTVIDDKDHLRNMMITYNEERKKIMALVSIYL